MSHRHCQMLSFILPPAPIHTGSLVGGVGSSYVHNSLGLGSQTTKILFLTNYLTKNLVLLITMKKPCKSFPIFLFPPPSSTFLGHPSSHSRTLGEYMLRNDWEPQKEGLQGSPSPSLSNVGGMVCEKYKA